MWSVLTSLVSELNPVKPDDAPVFPGSSPPQWNPVSEGFCPAPDISYLGSPLLKEVGPQPGIMVGCGL